MHVLGGLVVPSRAKFKQIAGRKNTRPSVSQTIILRRYNGLLLGFFYFTHDLNKRFFLCSAAGAAGGGEKSSLSLRCARWGIILISHCVALHVFIPAAAQ
jgi:hypothetical protein